MSEAVLEQNVIEHERRRFARVPVRLPGRFMLPDHSEHACTSENISPGGILLTAEKIAVIGTRVVCYLDQIGRVEGVVTRTTPSGFAMTIAATVRKRDKLAAQLMWLANRNLLGLPEDRRHERVIPRSAMTEMVMPSGRRHMVRIIDLSQSGAGIASDIQMEIGTAVTLGNTRARVIRQIEGGFAVEFSRPIPSHDLDVDTVL
jgi:hypothetical protein